MTVDQVIIDGVWMPCTLVGKGVNGAGVWHQAVVTLPDGRAIPGVHHPDPSQARLSAWWRARRVHEAGRRWP